MAAAAAEEKRAWSDIRSGSRAFLHALLRWLNYTVLAAAAIAMVVVLALRIAPTPWGWSFLAISAIAMASSALGSFSSSSSSSSSAFSSPSSRCCYGVSTSLLAASAFLQGSLFLLFVSRPDSVLSRLDAQRGASDSRLLLKIAAAALLWTCFADLLLLALSCLLHRCSAPRPSAPHGYVDLEAAALDPSDPRPFFLFSSSSFSKKRNAAKVQEVASMDPKPSAEEGKKDNMSKKKEQEQQQQQRQQMQQKNGSEDGCKKMKEDPSDEKEEDDDGKSTGGHV